MVISQFYFLSKLSLFLGMSSLHFCDVVLQSFQAHSGGVWLLFDVQFWLEDDVLTTLGESQRSQRLVET